MIKTRFLAATTAAVALSLAAPTAAGAAPQTDADLAKSVACSYAASVAQHAENGVGNSRSEKLISQRGSLYLVECEVRVMQRGNATVYINDPRPALIYRVTVDANNRFFVVNAEGPYVPPVRQQAPGRAA
ncbi:hypothetical protein FK268_01385 [Tsukamurella sputi]|uniref:Uncharacterized protein n=1 Tax=Tsukamurella sputi TaxID=2591848 RepID=A0A5C5RUR9_9ACTN|nr:hypothetical protein [Tsukamurella sputi]TWS25935.1 hypothetical protein FK268_01385 [Tsukamurella sputi]